jgi:hypothetical protein
VLGRGLLGAMAAAAGMRDPNLWTEGVPGPTCQVPDSRSRRSCCCHRRTKPVVSVSSGACFLGQAAASTGESSLLAYSFCYLWSRGSYGSCLYRDASFPGVSG